MSFDQDPNEQANISGADFAMMLDEMRSLQQRVIKLETLAKTQHDTLVKSLTTFHFADQTKEAIKTYENFFNGVQRNGGFV